MKEIIIFRLFHRLPRDERVTTHIALVARAFGAIKMYYTGEKDEEMEVSIKNVVSKWGGKFEIEYTDIFKLKELKKEGYHLIHLTMYGQRIETTDLPSDKIILIVGSEKVPKWIYEFSDMNISVTNQPHSEIAAITIALHLIYKGKELSQEFENDMFKGRVKIIPSNKDKIVIKKKEDI